jgi:hypothetical protein
MCFRNTDFSLGGKIWVCRCNYSRMYGADPLKTLSVSALNRTLKITRHWSHIFALALSIDENQSTFRHSSRKRPLPEENLACTIPLMRQVPSLFIAIMCLSLLTMQMSGLHLHANADSQSGALHGAHFHEADIDGHGHDHEVEIDVSPFETGTTWSKLIPFLVSLVFVLLTTVSTSKTVWPPSVERLPIRHRSRWRPPLRAPPQHIL